MTARRIATWVLSAAVAACGDPQGVPEEAPPETDQGSATESASSGGSDAGSAGSAPETSTSGSDGSESGPGPDAGTPGGDGDTYYVAPNGDDSDPGTLEAPFASLTFAIGKVEPGDTIFVRGGTYALAHSVELSGSGEPERPIRLWAYADEVPVLDFSDNPRHANPPQPREDDSVAATGEALGLYVPGGSDWWHVKGLTVRNAAYYGVRVYGSNNIFERLVLHDNKASGLEITGKEGWSPSDNLVLNCDSFHNFDPQSNGEDADGFAAKFDSLGPGNTFRGTRAWSNSDDGYDFWHAEAVQIENCWSFDNGFNRDEWVPMLSGGFEGDGMGFKLGQEAGELVLHHVAAWGNKAFGIDENGNGSAGGVEINHATLVNNAKDGNPIQISLDDGRPHAVRNSIAFDVDAGDVTSFSGPVDTAFNTWDGIGVSAADFVDIDMAALFAAGVGPRGADGELPGLGLQLSPSSALIDAGTDVGLPYEGAAPDLGAFERP